MAEQPERSGALQRHTRVKRCPWITRSMVLQRIGLTGNVIRVMKVGLHGGTEPEGMHPHKEARSARSTPRKGILFVLSAPSGSGKSTLVARVRQVFPDMLYSISCTTRAPRPGETEGIHYHFLAEQQFREMIERDQFLEWKEVHDHLYGTPAEPVIRAIESGRRMILDIDVEGAREVFRKIHNAVGIFVSPPSMAVLEQRLRARDTDSEATIRTRMINATKEMEAAPLFDYQIVNDDLDRAVDELTSIIRTETDAAG